MTDKTPNVCECSGLNGSMRPCLVHGPWYSKALNTYIYTESIEERDAFFKENQ